MIRLFAFSVALLLVATFALVLSRIPQQETRDQTTSFVHTRPTTSTTDHAELTHPLEAEKPVVKSKRVDSYRPTRAWTWDDMARCESGGNWADTRGGYEGGVHFAHETWIAAGGRRFAEHAYQATREQQIEVAESWLARTSLAQWPVCSYKIGAR